MSWWEFLKGSPEDFSLQSRIYNSVCIVTILVIAYNVPFALVLGSWEEALPFIILLPVQLFLYYLSRFKHRLVLSFVIYSILINIFFSYNYFINGGIQGSTLLSFCITYFLIIAIVPRWQYGIWTFGHLVLVMGLLYYEHKHPESIMKKYTGSDAVFIDSASTYIINTILILACLSYIRNNYAIEKSNAEERALKMKSLNQKKDKLISIISHDFSSPLTNIRTYLNILQKKELNQEERGILEGNLHQMTMDAQELLNNLLMWTKNQLEFTETVIDTINVNQVLQNTLRLLAHLADEKGISIDYRIDDSVEIEGNASMFDLVIRNLINNAIKFSNFDGVIVIRSVKEDTHFKFLIEDNGIGISEELQHRIFSKGVESSFGTRNEKGAGIGLQICKEFTKAQNGDIWFSSKEGVGTTFYLRFPAKASS